MIFQIFDHIGKYSFLRVCNSPRARSVTYREACCRVHMIHKHYAVLSVRPIPPVKSIDDQFPLEGGRVLLTKGRYDESHAAVCTSTPSCRSDLGV